jgi:hypothetical protein
MSDAERPDPSTSDEPAEGEQPDPGAFVGNRPERQASTIPGGVRPDDERVAAHSTQSTGTPEGATPDGHREPDRDAARRREAGQDR